MGDSRNCRNIPITLIETQPRIAATHNATHNKDHLHVLRRTYAAVRDLQVVECIR